MLKVSSANVNTRFTKKGNAYQKTNIGKITGAIAGAAYGAFSTIKNRDMLIQAKNDIKANMQNAELGISDKKIKVGLAIGVGVGIAILSLYGTVLGTIGDIIANKVKANNADRANNKIDAEA